MTLLNPRPAALLCYDCVRVCGDNATEAVRLCDAHNSNSLRTRNAELVATNAELTAELDKVTTERAIYYAACLHLERIVALYRLEVCDCYMMHGSKDEQRIHANHEDMCKMLEVEQ